jgi:uncharacterized coiled-coil DUF342 family protein
VTSEAVDALIEEIEAAIAAFAASAEEADIIVRSTIRSVKEKREAQRTIEHAASERQRLQSAIADLRERLKELEQQEKDARRWVKYREVEAECNKLAAELAAVYPELAKKLGELLPRLVENERLVAYVNELKLPSDAWPLRTAEMVARGIERNVDFPRLLRVLRLPTFEYSPHEPYVWPRSR